MDIYYNDGDFVTADQALISVNDLSVLRGYGVFDFLRTYSGFPFHLEDHLNRLERSTRLIGLNLPETVDELKTIVNETLHRNNHPESDIRIVVTGGISPDNITPGASPKLLVLVTAVTEFSADLYSKGAKVISCQVDRFLPGAKSINYIPAILCQEEARSRQAIEAIYVDRGGYLLEGTTSNFFALFGKTLVTPPADRLLPGITRQVILKLAAKEYTIEIRNIHKDEIRLMDEAFITSSVKEVIPVVAIDAIKLSGERPGPQTRKIMHLFKGYTSGYKG